MRRLVFMGAALFLLSSVAFAYDYQPTPTEDAFTDSFYFNCTEGYKYSGWTMQTDAGGHPIDGDRLWAGATVNYQAEPPTIDGTEFARAYLKFDLTNYDNIDKAYLWMYRVKDPWEYNDPDKGNVSVSMQSNDWNEHTITWENSPAFDNNVTKTSIYIDEPDGGWVSWNVSNFAKQAQGGNFTLVLSSAQPFHIFESSETSNGHSPFLGINVVPEPISCLLFGIGGLTLAASRKLKRRRS